MSDDSLPVPRDSSRDLEAWLRIRAFLAAKSENTKRTYVPVIKEWCDFIGAEVETAQGAEKLLQASELHAAGYLEWLKGRPGMAPRLKSSASSERSIKKRSSRARNDGLRSTLSNSTIAKKTTILRRIYRTLIAANLGLRRNPFDGDIISAPPARSGLKRPTEMVPFEKVSEILSLPDKTTLKGQRDRALLAILFGGGLRRSEAREIRIGDIKQTRQGTVYLRLRATKGKVDADQALPDWAGEEVLLLMKSRKRDGALSGDHLFVSFAGQGGRTQTLRPISTSGIYKIFRKYCALAGVDAPVSPHSARATAITKLLEDGETHREVKEFSRHASIGMVELYDKRRYSIDESPARKLNFDSSSDDVVDEE